MPSNEINPLQIRSKSLEDDDILLRGILWELEEDAEFVVVPPPTVTLLLLLDEHCGKILAVLFLLELVEEEEADQHPILANKEYQLKTVLKWYFREHVRAHVEMKSFFIIWYVSKSSVKPKQKVVHWLSFILHLPLHGRSSFLIASRKLNIT